MNEPPHGYLPITDTGFFVEAGFLLALGKLYYRQDGGDFSVKVLLGPQQMNLHGRAHGGMLSAIADLSIGGNIVAQGHGKHGLATVSLKMDFMDLAVAGEWLESRSNLTKVGKSTAFGTAMLSVGDRRVAHATAIFKIFSAR